MLFQTRFNTSFKMYRLLTVQGGFVHADIRYNFENCYKSVCRRMAASYSSHGIRFIVKPLTKYMLSRHDNCTVCTHYL